MNAKELSISENSIWNISPTNHTISISPIALCDLIESKALSASTTVSCSFGTTFLFRGLFQAENFILSHAIDHSFGETTPNREVYESMVQPVVDSFLDGINGTVMVYGPTGAGKTYTMLGNDEKREYFRGPDELLSGRDHSFAAAENDGVLLYAMHEIFEKIVAGTDSSAKSTTTTTTNIIKCSYVEIYNDSIYDLLQEKSRLQVPLGINELDTKEFVVKDAIEHPVDNFEQFVAVVKKGERMVFFEVQC